MSRTPTAITTWPRWASACRPRGPPPRPGARPSTPARAGCTCPPSRRRNAGTTGWSCPPGPGRRGEEKHYMLVPTTCFNCESACGLLAYVDRDTGQVRKFEGNPEHPGSRGRNCAKGPATINQVTDPDRVLYPMKRAGRRGEGRWEQDQLGRGARRAGGAHPGGARPRAARTRSWSTSAARARTGSPSGCWPAGASTGTTRTPTCAPAAAGPDSSSGWASTGPAPTTPTPRSST